MDVMQYIKPELMLVIPICWGIGAALKRTPHIADWTIPYLLLGIFHVWQGSWLWLCLSYVCLYSNHAGNFVIHRQCRRQPACKTIWKEG